MITPESDLQVASQTDLAALSRRGRWLIMKTVANSKAGHIGGPLSAMDLWIALFFRVLHIRPEQPDWPDRDRFILSKGHAAVGLYVAMALRGYFPVEELATFDKANSRLQGHPDMLKLPGLEASTGSLGQGLSVGLGIALGARMRQKAFTTWVMLGDGELQEGVVWESVQIAARYKLGNLVAIVDWNGLQQYGWPNFGEASPRSTRRDPWHGTHPGRAFEAFGWKMREVDGHDFDDIIAACEAARNDAVGEQPTVIVARTIKGKGISFTEGNHDWHSKSATAQELAQARRELQIGDDE